MENLEFAHSFWSIFRTFNLWWGTTFTLGFWTRKTIDRVSQFPGQRGIPSPLYRFLAPGSIRLLRLLPGHFEEPLQAELVHCELTESIQTYEALSYCWGDPQEHYTVCLDGTFVRIRANLGRALRQIRCENEERWLWVDALCINQDDIQERNHQVGTMINIYRTASRVIIWLGTESESTAVGMQVIEHLAKSNHTSTEPIWATLLPDLLVSGLNDIMERDYFSRLWVVQESAVAREAMLMCGRHRVTWKTDSSTVKEFIKSIKLAVISPQWDLAGLRSANMDQLVQLLQFQLAQSTEIDRPDNSDPADNLLQMIYDTRNRNFTDPRDRYFAIQGMVGRHNASLITPDYALPVQNVYQQVQQLFANKKTSDTYSNPDSTVSGPADLDQPSSAKEKIAAIVGIASREGSMVQERNEELEPINHEDSVGNVEGFPDTPSLDQHEILKFHINTACSRAMQYITEGMIDRAAAELKIFAKNVEECSGREEKEAPALLL